MVNYRNYDGQDQTARTSQRKEPLICGTPASTISAIGSNLTVKESSWPTLPPLGQGNGDRDLEETVLTDFRLKQLLYQIPNFCKKKC